MMIAFILSWLVIGLFAGFLANATVHARHGLLFDCILGLVGAVVGAVVVGAAVGFQAHSLIAHVIVAFFGAVVLLALARLVDRPQHGFR
jgi:uncharacterized membrane protein YeaQ/YmgE (transglycosylase-associated protein family)